MEWQPSAHQMPSGSNDASTRQLTPRGLRSLTRTMSAISSPSLEVAESPQPSFEAENPSETESTRGQYEQHQTQGFAERPLAPPTKSTGVDTATNLFDEQMSRNSTAQQPSELTQKLIRYTGQEAQRVMRDTMKGAPTQNPFLREIGNLANWRPSTNAPLYDWQRARGDAGDLTTDEPVLLQDSGNPIRTKHSASIPADSILSGTRESEKPEKRTQKDLARSVYHCLGRDDLGPRMEGSETEITLDRSVDKNPVRIVNGGDEMGDVRQTMVSGARQQTETPGKSSFEIMEQQSAARYGDREVIEESPKDGKEVVEESGEQGKLRRSSRRTKQPAVERTPVLAPVLTTAPKSFRCPICEYRFTRVEHLKRHHRTRHTRERPFKCSHCSKTFARSDNLGEHRRTHNVGSERSNGSGGGNASFGEDEETEMVDTAPEMERTEARLEERLESRTQAEDPEFDTDELRTHDTMAASKEFAQHSEEQNTTADGQALINPEEASATVGHGHQTEDDPPSNSKKDAATSEQNSIPQQPKEFDRQQSQPDTHEADEIYEAAKILMQMRNSAAVNASLPFGRPTARDEDTISPPELQQPQKDPPLPLATTAHPTGGTDNTPSRRPPASSPPITSQAPHKSQPYTPNPSSGRKWSTAEQTHLFRIIRDNIQATWEDRVRLHNQSYVIPFGKAQGGRTKAGVTQMLAAELGAWGTVEGLKGKLEDKLAELAELVVGEEGEGQGEAVQDGKGEVVDPTENDREID